MDGGAAAGSDARPGAIEGAEVGGGGAEGVADPTHPVIAEALADALPVASLAPASAVCQSWRRACRMRAAFTIQRFFRQQRDANAALRRDLAERCRPGERVWRSCSLPTPMEGKTTLALAIEASICEVVCSMRRGMMLEDHEWAERGPKEWSDDEEVSVIDWENDSYSDPSYPPTEIPSADESDMEGECCTPQKDRWRNLRKDKRVFRPLMRLLVCSGEELNPDSGPRDWLGFLPRAWIAALVRSGVIRRGFCVAARLERQVVRLVAPPGPAEHCAFRHLLPRAAAGLADRRDALHMASGEADWPEGRNRPSDLTGARRPREFLDDLMDTLMHQLSVESESHESWLSEFLSPSVDWIDPLDRTPLTLAWLLRVRASRC